ncbi:hypothetical protein [Actinomycetospora sp. NBC_00405]|uniref:hypothetical protein n=1 Tax=Actinomycetospora sp. NBC_00405 TaxID=2975952 RepID=UPI002E1A267C
MRQARGCWDVLSDAWARVTSGGAWQADQELFGGLLGWARVVEVTDGDNGWHVHIHALLCFGAQVSADLVGGSVGARMFARWRATLERKGFDASEEHGWDLRRVQLGDGDLADYFTKIAHEVTGSHRKEGRRAGGRTPMQLLADAVDTYDETAVARWWAWEQASEGRRQLTWSTGLRDLRKLAGLGAVATDEDVAAEDLEAEARLGLSVDAWEYVEHARLAPELLAVAEDGGMHAARNWLAARALPWIDEAERPRLPANDHRNVPLGRSARS